MSNSIATTVSGRHQDPIAPEQPNPSSENNASDLPKHIFAPVSAQQLPYDFHATIGNAPDVDGNFDAVDGDVDSAAARPIGVSAESPDLSEPLLNINPDYFNCAAERAPLRFRGPKDAAIQFTHKIQTGLMRSPQSVQPKSPKLFSCLLEKQLALSLGISDREGASMRYESGNSQIFCQNISQECRTSPFIDDRIRQELADAFVRASSDVRAYLDSRGYSDLKNLHQTASFIKNGELVILPTCWPEHTIVLVFHENHLYICNRGEGLEENPDSGKAIVIKFEIDSTRISTGILNQIQSQWRVNTKEAIIFFKETLPRLLSRKEQGVIRSQTPFENSKQIVGNCCFASTMQALFLVINLLSNQSQEECTEMYEKTLLSLQLGYLDKYIYHTDGFSDFNLDLVQDCAYRIALKLKKFPDFPLSAYPHATAFLPNIPK